MMTRWTAAIALVSSVACFNNPSRIDLGPTPSGVVVDARLQYYDVSAASMAELRRAMVQLGPRWEGRTYQAVTESRFRWNYVSARWGQLLCEPTRIRVSVQTYVVFPRWNPSAEPDSAMIEWWQQLSVGLMEHERGHARLSVKTAGDIARALEEMTPAPCDQLAGLVSQTGQRHITIERRLQIEYDRTTRHGATQIELARRLRSP